MVDVVLNPQIASTMQSDKTLLATVMHLFEFYFNEKHKLVIQGSTDCIQK